jgi:hypothetical protein
VLKAVLAGRLRPSGSKLCGLVASSYVLLWRPDRWTGLRIFDQGSMMPGCIESASWLPLGTRLIAAASDSPPLCPTSYLRHGHHRLGWVRRAERRARPAVGRHGAGPAMVLLAGDAGVGKTRLLVELADRARERGVQVLIGGCLELGDVGLPYVPIVAALCGFAAESGTRHELTGSRQRRHVLTGVLCLVVGSGRRSRPSSSIMGCCIGDLPALIRGCVPGARAAAYEACVLPARTR